MLLSIIKVDRYTILFKSLIRQVQVSLIMPITYKNYHNTLNSDNLIREETEPCEKHDKLHCKECETAANQNLKRSISYNAINQRRRTASISNLQRTMSQTSLCSGYSIEVGKAPTNIDDIRNNNVTSRPGKNHLNYSRLASMKSKVQPDSLSHLSSEDKDLLLMEMINYMYENEHNNNPTTQITESELARTMADEIRKLEQLRAYKERQSINLKIDELKELITRYQLHTPLHTPETNNISMGSTPTVLNTDSSIIKLKQQYMEHALETHNENYTEKRMGIPIKQKSSLINTIAKKIFSPFKHKKKRPAALKLYREIPHGSSTIHI